MKNVIALLLTSFTLFNAQANCIPADLGGKGSKLVYSENGKGCWVGWWCPSTDPNMGKWHPQPYIAAAIKSKRGLVGTRREFWQWVQQPSSKNLTFGLDPHTDPALKVVWYSERSKLESVK